jgi:hypothetical protein
MGESPLPPSLPPKENHVIPNSFTANKYPGILMNQIKVNE